jgi:hypothetical protein
MKNHTPFTTTPPSPASRWVLLVGTLLTLLGVIEAWLSTQPGELKLFENLHWTVATSTAAVLAWLGVQRVSRPDRLTAQLLAMGLTAYALGQWVWDVQAWWGYTHFPAPADALYLLLGPSLAAGFVRFIRTHASATQRPIAWLDTITLCLSLWTLVLVLYLPVQGSTSWLDLGVLMAYPATLFAALSVTLVMLPTLRLRLSWDVVAATLGLMTTTGCWMAWNFLALQGVEADGA